MPLADDLIDASGWVWAPCDECGAPPDVGHWWDCPVLGDLGPDTGEEVGYEGSDDDD